MTTNRLIILLAVLLGGLSSVYLLPKVSGFMPIGVEMKLPDGVGEWWGQDGVITQKERDVLGKGTDFARKQYTNGRGDVIQVSIVLSSEDMMTSIHRPERCLAAQDWICQPTGNRFVEVPKHGVMPVARLKNHQTKELPDGRPFQFENLAYYWFAGNTELTASHEKRVLSDTVDRITGGYVQRWAMMLVSANVTKNMSKFGRDEKDVDEMLTQFIKELAPRIHKDTVKYR
jgi:EpsI family protein